MQQLSWTAALAAVLTAVPAYAGSITGDGFQATMSEDSYGAVELDGSTAPATGTAGLPGVDLVTDRLEIDWLDDDTFTLRVTWANDSNNLQISLADLNFKVGSTPVNITGVTFDDPNTPEETYDGYQGIAGPSTAFTADSITVTFAAFPSGPSADGIPWHFDVQTSGTQTSVPESFPGSMIWLLVGGLSLAMRKLRG